MKNLKATLILNCMIHPLALADPCLTPEQLMPKINTCMQNKVAVVTATACEKWLKKEWDKAAIQLQKHLSLAHLDRHSDQQSEIGNSRRDYHNTKVQLQNKIRQLKKKLGYMSRYPAVMITAKELLPGGVHPICYQEPRDAVAKIFRRIGTELKRAEVIEGMALNKRNISHGAHERIADANDTKNGLNSPEAGRARPVEELVDLTPLDDGARQGSAFSGSNGLNTGSAGPVGSTDIDSDVATPELFAVSGEQPRLTERQGKVAVESSYQGDSLNRKAGDQPPARATRQFKSMYHDMSKAAVHTDRPSYKVDAKVNEAELTQYTGCMKNCRRNLAAEAEIQPVYQSDAAIEDRLLYDAHRMAEAKKEKEFRAREQRRLQEERALAAINERAQSGVSDSLFGRVKLTYSKLAMSVARKDI